MSNLKTKYMGIELSNPIIVGASPMTSNIDDLKRLEKAGAAAIVYRSLFEEQIQLEKAQFEDEMVEYTERHAEMITLFPRIEHAGPEEHLVNLRKARESVSLPMFASLNAIYNETWLEYAKLIQETGVNGLELNFYNTPKNFELAGESVEKQQLEILKEIKKVVTIPVSLKLSSFYSNTLNFINKADKEGANGFVLFNRFYHTDIDTTKLEIGVSHHLSNEADNKLPMRYAGLLYNNISANICCNGGIQNGNDVVKMILAGADCVQVVSAVYQHKMPHLKAMLDDLDKWMTDKKYNNIDDFRGLLSRKRINDPFAYQRAQYIDLLINSNEIIKKYPLR
jgi:dihydroorotate dehydrogenase (fumarate)